MFSYFARQATCNGSVDSEFRLRMPFDKRQQAAATCKLQHPNKIPIIIESSRGAPVLNKKMHAFPNTLNFFHIKSYILEQLKKDPKTKDSLLDVSALIVLVGTTGSYMPSTKEKLSDIYEKYKSEDGFLYLTYSIELTFG